MLLVTRLNPTLMPVVGWPGVLSQTVRILETVPEHKQLWQNKVAPCNL